MERSHAEKVLELPRLLAQVASRCDTEFGREVVLSLQPSFDRVLIEQRIKRTDEAVALVLAGDIPVYANARDVREPVRNAAKGSLLPGDTIFRVAETLGAMSRLGKWLQSHREKAPTLWLIGERIPFLSGLQKTIEESVAPDGSVLDGASAELKAIRAKKAAQSKRILDRIQSMVNSLRSYLQEPLFTERSGRFVLPVKAAYKGKVPGIVHDSSGSGQTLYIEPQVIVDETNKLRELDGQEREEVEKILLALSTEIGRNAQEVVLGLESLAEIDATLACGKDAEKTDAHTPKLLSEAMIKVERGHHPLLDREISVPLDVAVGGSFDSLLITGPNTGGKTVCLKVLGLYSLMIGCGVFPPAKRVEYGAFSGVWADIGDEQSLEQSLSTFSGHLRNVSRALKQAGRGALCLFDEIGAGTDPAEGAAIGKAVLNALAERGAVIAATTHYGELKGFAVESEYFRTAAMEFDLETLRPTYRLIPGATGASHAFEIARRYGLPDDVAERAKSLLGTSAKSEREKAAALDALISEARASAEEMDRYKREAALELERLQGERAKTKEKLQSVRDSARDALAEAIREMRSKYRELLESTTHISGAKREELLEYAREIEQEFVEAAEHLEVADAPVAREIEVGDTVQVRGRPQPATVLDVLRNGGLVLQLGALRITVKPEDVEPVNVPVAKSRPTRKSASVAAISQISTEVMLRRMRAEEAIEALDAYLDDAMLAGLHKARIVHGKGDGILKKVVREFLSGRSEVARYYEASTDDGGSGVTIVEFK